ncbi:hypothetical protein GCM10020331_058040 [Ectobacillus funiculus]
MLFETKAAIKDFAAAITEASSPEIHTFYHKELQKKRLRSMSKFMAFFRIEGFMMLTISPSSCKKDISYAAEALQQ